MDKRNIQSTQGVNILSLFDGMACGMIAMLNAGARIERYVAYEIDKYAVKTSSHNFPMIEHHGDVFDADFTEFKDFDFLVGGSPCTYWSIAQKNNRETEASGMGWELFCQYVRALKEAQPKFFIYENNKSMSQAIKESITKTFGFEPICINSALVSAQNRQRLYWVGRRNADGTYSKVDVKQPEDRGILLRDVLDGGFDLTCNDKGYTLTASYDGAVAWNTIERHQRNMVAEPVIFQTPHGFNNGGVKYEKSPTLTANGSWQENNKTCEPVFIGEVPEHNGTYRNGKQASQQYRVYDTNAKGVAVTTCAITNVAEPVAITSDGKAFCLTANYPGAHMPHSQEKSVRSMVAEPIKVGAMPRPNGELSTSQAFRIYDTNAKTVTINSGGGGAGGKTGLYAIPVNATADEKRHTVKAQYYKNGIANFITNGGFAASAVAEPINTTKEGKFQTIKAQYQQTSPANILGYTSTYGASGVAESIMGYAIVCEVDGDGRPTKAISGADGKTYTVYRVINGKITIREKEYDIKLADGFYIIRKLTVRECMRLQTVPEWYEFPVSDSQAYKMLGNGWTCDVITHLILSAIEYFI